MRLEGGCYCGAIRYESDGEPFHETICHCDDCRRVTGAANVAWFSVSADSFRFTAGAPVRFRSTPAVERSFCGACGTTLTYQADEAAGEIDITIASLDDPEALRPKDHTEAADRLGWDRPGDALPIYDKRRIDG